MKTCLYRLSCRTWVVASSHDDAMTFASIEEASEYLCTLGVKSDEIDQGLISMLSSEHTCAHFDASGNFTGSDNSSSTGQDSFGMA